MNILDIIISIVILLGFINGYSRGLISQLSGFIGIFIAVWGSLQFSDIVGKYLLENDLVSAEFISIASIIATFLLIYIGIKIISRLFEKTIKTVGLGFVNRLGGSIFGAGIAILVLTALAYLGKPLFNFFLEEEVKNSQFISLLQQLGEALKGHYFS